MNLFFAGLVSLITGSLIGYFAVFLYDSVFLKNMNTVNYPELHNLNQKEETSAIAGNSNTAKETGQNIIPSLTTELPAVSGASSESEIGKQLDSSALIAINESEEIIKLINFYASRYGVDSNIIKHLAECESGLNPDSKNKNKAGLFQLSPEVWKVNRGEMGENDSLDLRYDIEESVKTAAYILSVGKRWVWPVC